MKNKKTIASKGKSITLAEAISKKVDEARKELDVQVNPNALDLGSQITLGNDWDNPFKLGEALDRQPGIYANWASALSILKREQKKLKEQFDVWQSERKLKIRDFLIIKNKKKGLTNLQAIKNVTNSMVDDEFNKRYHSGVSAYDKYNEKLVSLNDNIETLEIIVTAFKQRKDMLQNLSLLVRSLVENNLLIVKKSKGKGNVKQF